MLLPDRMYRPITERTQTDGHGELSVQIDRFPSASEATATGANPWEVREVQRAPSGRTHAPPVD